MALGTPMLNLKLVIAYVKSKLVISSPCQSHVFVYPARFYGRMTLLPYKNRPAK